MIKITNPQIDKIKELITKDDFYSNERLWTFLLAYILSESKNRKDYLKLFCDDELSISSDIDIWFEAQPLVARSGSSGYTEGNNILDLAFGSIKKRGNGASTIEYNDMGNGSWACFVETKLCTDIQPGIKHDPLKNQMVRIIESLLCFQGGGICPEHLFFTLLTPRLFKNKPNSRLYGYKIDEYKDQKKIIDDIRQSKIRERHQHDWNYPKDLEKRVKSLYINWITYEDIFEKEYTIEDLNLTSMKSDEIECFKDKIEKILKKY